MSFSAYVVCNCYQRGKIIEPPYKEYLKFDEDGLYLDIPTDFYDKNREKPYQLIVLKNRERRLVNAKI